jgi:hypothetical protein
MKNPYVHRAESGHTRQSFTRHRLLSLAWVIASALCPAGCTSIEDTGSESHFVCESDSDCPIGVCHVGYCQYKGERYEQDDVPSEPEAESSRDSGRDETDASRVEATPLSSSDAASFVPAEADAGPPDCVGLFEEAAERTFGVDAEAKAAGFTMSCLVRFFDEANGTGLPFVREVFAFGDTVTTFDVTNPEPGRVCMAGKAASSAGENGGWGATLLLQVADMNAEETMVDAPFDAASLGITRFDFTLTTPPNSGVGLGLSTVTNSNCEEPPGCTEGGSFRRMADGYPVAYTEGDTYTVNMVNFEHPPWAPSSIELDLTKIMAFEVYVTTTATAANYAFCVDDLTFFDDDGNVVTPR